MVLLARTTSLTKGRLSAPCYISRLDRLRPVLTLMSYWVQLKKKGAIMITDSRDKVIGGLGNSRGKVIGGLENSLQVHHCHRDFHSAFMVLLDLGRVRPLKGSMEWDDEETEAWIRGEKVAFQLRFFHTRQLDNELRAEMKFRLEELDSVFFWRDYTPEARLQALIQVDEAIMACKCVGRKDLIEGAISKLERLFLFNHADQAEFSEQVGSLLKDHPRDGKWGELLGRIAKAKESVALAKAVMGR